MDWQALPQCFGSDIRDTLSSVHRLRGSGSASGGVHYGGRGTGPGSLVRCLVRLYQVVRRVAPWPGLVPLSPWGHDGYRGRCLRRAES